jgi:hypothetical protein
MNMQSSFIVIAVILLLIPCLVPGCLNHVNKSVGTDDNTPFNDIQQNPSPRIFYSIENEPIKSDYPSSSCNETRFTEVFRITRIETPYSGKTPIIELNIMQAVDELGPDFKIPKYIPDGFYFHYVTLPEWNNKENKISLVFVNKSHEGFFVAFSSSNQMYIAFSKDIDVEFWEFVDQEPEFVCINGTPGFYYASSDRNKLRWLDGDVERWIVGPFKSETLIRIADSMKSPSQLDLTSEIYTGNTTSVPGTLHPGITVPVTPINSNTEQYKTSA